MIGGLLLVLGGVCLGFVGSLFALRWAWRERRNAIDGLDEARRAARGEP